MQVDPSKWLSNEKAQISLLVPSWVPSKLSITQEPSLQRKTGANTVLDTRDSLLSEGQEDSVVFEGQEPMPSELPNLEQELQWPDEVGQIAYCMQI